MDLKVQVIASNITNLTDARYFAAYGVHYLLFDLTEINIAGIKEIIDWVSGPKTLLLFSTENSDDIDEAVLKLEPYAIGSKDAQLDLSYLDGHMKMMSLRDESDTDIELEGHPYTLFDASRDQSHVILRGSTESKTGFKSFDDLDEILDSLVLEV